MSEVLYVPMPTIPVASSVLRTSLAAVPQRTAAQHRTGQHTCRHLNCQRCTPSCRQLLSKVSFQCVNKGMLCAGSSQAGHGSPPQLTYSLGHLATVEQAAQGHTDDTLAFLHSFNQLEEASLALDSSIAPSHPRHAQAAVADAAAAPKPGLQIPGSTLDPGSHLSSQCDALPAAVGSIATQAAAPPARQQHARFAESLVQSDADGSLPRGTSLTSPPCRGVVQRRMSRTQSVGVARVVAMRSTVMPPADDAADWPHVSAVALAAVARNRRWSLADGRMSLLRGRTQACDSSTDRPTCPALEAIPLHTVRSARAPVSAGQGLERLPKDAAHDTCVATQADRAVGAPPSHLAAVDEQNAQTVLEIRQER